MQKPQHAHSDDILPCHFVTQVCETVPTLLIPLINFAKLPSSTNTNLFISLSFDLCVGISCSQYRAFSIGLLWWCHQFAAADSIGWRFQMNQTHWNLDCPIGIPNSFLGFLSSISSPLWGCPANTVSRHLSFLPSFLPLSRFCSFYECWFIPCSLWNLCLYNIVHIPWQDCSI